MMGSQPLGALDLDSAVVGASLASHSPQSSHQGIDPRPLRCRSSGTVSGEVAGGGCAL